MSFPAEPAARPGNSPVLARAPHRIGLVSLVVRDLDRVAGFYEREIGLRPLAGAASAPGTRRLGNGREALVELRHDPGARPDDPRGAGLFHTAFLLPGRAVLGAWLRHAASRALRLQGASDHGVSEALYLADPEGNGIEIYADRDEADWPRTGEGGIRMFTERLDLRALAAAEGAVWDGFPADGTVGHVHLRVGAIPAAEAFYTGLLGFDVAARYPGGSFFGSGGYHHQLAANVWQSPDTAPRAEGAAGLAEVEILADPQAIAALRDRLGDAAPPAGPSLALRDPWNTRIVLTPR